ncbi:MAG: NADH-quinone oxidoreductase subunit L [Chitinophagia bacterium]|nr:NADH-quinone oxidoreductase subunit L [Chitinophagia bacterium]
MNDMIKYGYLIPLLPLIGFLINGLGRNFLSKKISSTIGSGVLILSFVCSLLVFNQVTKPGFNTQVLFLFDFIKTAGLDIPFALQFDQLSALFLLIITGIGSLIHIYSAAYMHEETEPHYARYFAYLNLFVFFMLILVLGSSYVTMFIGWEGVGLSSYLLIGYWFSNNNYNNAAKKAFVMNRIGDLGFLLAIFWMLSQFGVITYTGVFAKASTMPLSAITGITLLLFIGAMGKSAQIPLYTWLPDAMAGPTPVSALIHAATMVTAGIYMIARSNIMFSLAPVSQNLVAIIGIATALLAATIALKQNDIKKVLAYSTVSQLGLMFLALGVGSYTAGVFHVMTHAFFKALLFLGAGSVIHAMHHEQDIYKMGGLRKKLPITHITFLIGCLAIAGIPPFAGFFSKDEILTAALEKNVVYYVLGLLTSLMTAFYMFRMYFLTFHGNFRGTEEQYHHVHESPAAMTMPLMVLALLSIVGGWVGIPTVFAEDAHRLSSFLAPVFTGVHHEAKAEHLSHSLELSLMAGVVVLIIVSIFAAKSMFAKEGLTAEKSSSFGKLLENKWYVDELYDKIIVQPINHIASFFSRIIDNKIIDATVNGVGKLVQFSSRQMRLLQSGQVGSYVLIMVVSIIIFFIFQMFWKI